MRAVTGMRLSSAGLPLAVLSDGTAHAYHAGMAAWMQVADAAFPSSAFHSVLHAPSGRSPWAAHFCPEGIPAWMPLLLFAP